MVLWKNDRGFAICMFHVTQHAVKVVVVVLVAVAVKIVVVVVLLS